jgi:hypothetical protein
MDMDPKMKSAFEQAATGYDDAAQEKKAAELQRSSDRQQFAGAWRQKCLEVVLPALEQIGDALTPKGWDCEVTNKFEEMSATIVIHKGNHTTVAGGTRFPHVTFVADHAARTISVRAASIKQDGTEANRIPLEQVTEQFVQEAVLKVFQRIATGA